MHNTSYAPFQGRSNGNNESSVANSWHRALLYESFFLGTLKNGVQRASDTPFGSLQFTTNAGKFGTCCILDMPIHIQKGFYLLSDSMETKYAFRQFSKGRVGLLVFLNDGKPRMQGVERTFELPHLTFLKACAFNTNPTQRDAHIEEVFTGQLQLVVNKLANLIGKSQLIANLLHVGHKSHLIHPLCTETRDAMAFQQGSNLIESKLLFNIFRHRFFSGYMVFHQVGSSFSQRSNQA